MTRSFKIATKKGPMPVELIQRFTHQIGDRRYRFAIHRAPRESEPVLSEWKSGQRVSSLHFLNVGLDTIGMSYRSRAEVKLDQLVRAHSEKVVQHKLSAAPAINED